MKRNIKNQKGAISLFVLLSMMFFMAFMLGAFTLVNRRNATQMEALTETQKIYSNRPSAREQYDSIFVESGTSVVPITNIDQLKQAKSATGATKYRYLINGKIYTYQSGATYVLQNDIILDFDDTFNGKNNLSSDDKILDYLLYASTYDINLNGHSIYYYRKADNTTWKLVFYQNIGTSSASNLFTSSNVGRNADTTKFSILDGGISAYSKPWATNENYEFILMYSSNSGKFSKDKYNRWRQTNDPTKETIANVTSGTATATGFKSITNAIVGTGDVWGGLAKSTSTADCYLDGSTGSNSNTFSVGSYKFISSNGISTSAGADTTAKECLLFVRYK